MFSKELGTETTQRLSLPHVGLPRLRAKVPVLDFRVNLEMLQ
jgi:hypothetical protein